MVKCILAFIIITAQLWAVPEPNTMADYDQYITFVDYIEHEDNNLFQTAWGICYTWDWPDFPIEIRARKGLDFLFAPDLEFVIDHEKAHRFEAVVTANDAMVWIEFEKEFEELTGQDYDEELFANTYAKIRNRGAKSKLDKLVYNFIWMGKWEK